MTGDRELIFIDYKDKRQCQVSAAKLKTNRHEQWIEAHKEFFKSWAVKASPDSKTDALFLRIRKKSGSKIRMSIKFYQDSIITCQGESMLTWAFLYVPQMRAHLDGSPYIAAQDAEHHTLHFSGKNNILSNLCHDPIIVEGREYPSIENCYQAEKLAFHNMPQESIANAATNPDLREVLREGARKGN